MPRIPMSSCRIGVQVSPQRLIRSASSARKIQATRFPGTGLLTTADKGPKELRQHAAFNETAEALLGSAVRHMGLSTRAGVRSPVTKSEDGPGSRCNVWTRLLAMMRRMNSHGYGWTEQPRICKQQVRSSSLLVGSGKTS